MTQLAPDQLLAALRWRYAAKQFDPARKIPAEVWDALEESLVLTPSSFGLQPWKFIVVRDAAVRARLQPESWNQPQVTEASHFVVLASRTDLTKADIDAWITRMGEAQNKHAVLRHDYAGVAHDAIWAVVRDHLPALQRAVADLIERLERDDPDA